MDSPFAQEKTISDNAELLRKLRPAYESLLFPWEADKPTARQLSPREQWEQMTGKSLDDPDTQAEIDRVVANMQAASQRR